MRVTGKGQADTASVSGAKRSSGAAGRAPVAQAPVGAPVGGLQTAVLQPALAALRDMPDIDRSRVEELRAALANGEVPFDASRLAALIERYHGGHE